MFLKMQAESMKNKYKLNEFLDVKRLQTLQDRLSQRWLDDRVDRETRLLIEGRSRKDGPEGESSWQGRDPYGALVHVALPPETDHTGRMVPVRIIEAKKHSLMARRTGDIW